VTYQHLEPLSKQLTIVVGLTVVGLMAFGLAISFYRNALFEETLVEIHNQNNALHLRIASRYSDLAYFRSAQYRDKQAKINLNVVKPGEKVLVITENARSLNALPEDNPDQAIEREAAFMELMRQTPVIEHWSLYFFHPERIEELKRAL